MSKLEEVLTSKINLIASRVLILEGAIQQMMSEKGKGKGKEEEKTNAEIDREMMRDVMTDILKELEKEREIVKEIEREKENERKIDEREKRKGMMKDLVREMYKEVEKEREEVRAIEREIESAPKREREREPNMKIKSKTNWEKEAARGGNDDVLENVKGLDEHSETCGHNKIDVIVPDDQTEELDIIPSKDCSPYKRRKVVVKREEGPLGKSILARRESQRIIKKGPLQVSPYTDPVVRKPRSHSLDFDQLRPFPIEWEEEMENFYKSPATKNLFIDMVTFDANEDFFYDAMDQSKWFTDNVIL